MARMDGIILRPGEGRSISYAGSPVRIMLEQGGLALVETSIPAGFAGPPPHRHHDFDEGFFVLDGALTFRVGAQEVTGPAGTFALAQRGMTHTFSNPGDVPARVLSFWTPGWGLDFLEEMGTVLPAQGSPDLARVAEVYQRHNSTIADD
jgi:mannose-6-phosphate isomerase-like protein (cupin superfamily)